MASPRLVSRTVPWHEGDSLAFLDTWADASPRLLVEDPDGTAFAGVGLAAEVRASSLPEVEHEVHALLASVEASGPAPCALGGFAFRDGPSRGAWEAFPPAWFVVPRLLLRAGPTGAILTATVPRGEDPGALLAAARDMLPRARPHPATVKVLGNGEERARWLSAARDTIASIRRGDAEKVVLARQVAGEASGPIAPTRVLAALARRGCARFLVEPRAGLAFLGATPELLVSARGNEARTAAVAGSAGRGVSAAEEATFADRLLHDPKELHEHEVVVDAIRRALTGLAREIRIAGSPSPVAAGPVQHLVTSVDARLDRPVGAMRLAAALHPTPAVGGAPTAAALALISDAEPFDRGWYAGGVGWVAPDGDGTFLVALRSALLDGSSLLAWAGAGLVAESDPAREWDETDLKLRAIRDGLDQA
ncbi:MAG TPA: isochorismate synthase [Candidatus Thermoplasmatota archaeon]|nr:isochorismate synthase [Candidatus Thermoplasmatota archaeon]